MGEMFITANHQAGSINFDDKRGFKLDTDLTVSAEKNISILYNLNASSIHFKSSLACNGKGTLKVSDKIRTENLTLSGGQTEIKTKSKLISNSSILIQGRCGGIAIGKETSTPSEKSELTNFELTSLFAPSVTFQV
jgi:hypothetical protein